MKRAVITGPTGSIGIALINELSNAGVEVIAVVRPGSKRAERIPQDKGVTVAYCDLSQIQKLPEIIKDKCDVFYHFGWDGTFGNSRNNMQGQNLNVKYALDAVEAARGLGCECFVGAGSQAEYGRVEGKLNACTPAFPENGYGMAKLCAGQMTRGLCAQYGMRHVWTRILSIYGPYDGDKTMVMSTIGKLLSGERPACTAGEQMWDYLFSKDAALAMRLIGEKGVNGKVYCIGSGEAAPLKSYIEKIRDAVNPDAEIGFGEVPYADRQVMYLCADIDELNTDTGFKPAYTFEQGIKETVDWVKSTVK